MAIIRVGDIREIIRARGFKAANYSQEEIEEIKENKRRFVEDMIAEGNKYASSSEFTYKRMYNDDVVKLAETLEIGLGGIDGIGRDMYNLDNLYDDVDNMNDVVESVTVREERMGHMNIQELAAKFLALSEGTRLGVTDLETYVKSRHPIILEKQKEGIVLLPTEPMRFENIELFEDDLDEAFFRSDDYIYNDLYCRTYEGDYNNRYKPDEVITEYHEGNTFCELKKFSNREKRAFDNLNAMLDSHIKRNKPII